MPNSTLKSPAAQNLLAAAVAGAGIFFRPSRIPTWARRGLTVANTAGTASSLLMSDKDGQTGGALGLKPVTGTRNTTASAGSALAAAGGALSLITSGIGLKLDAKAENYLLKKGVKHPRLWMAIGAVGVVFLVKTMQDAATKKAESAASKLAQSRTEQPAGGQLKQQASKPTRAAATTPASSPARVAPAPSDGAEAKKPEAQVDSSAAPVAAAAAATADDAASAPGTPAAPQVEDTPIWTDVTKSAAEVDRADQAERDADAIVAADDDLVPAKDADVTDTNDVDDDANKAGDAHRPSAFEEQLARTTVDDIDEPTVSPTEGEQTN